MQEKRQTAKLAAMDVYEDALARLKADERSCNELERLSGIPAETLRDLKNGTTANPRLSTLRQLARLYELAA